MAFLPESRKLSRLLQEHLATPLDPKSLPATDQNMPKITIITPSFNQAHFLERTIISIHNQGYCNLEHIVIDGGSTDGSVEILEKYENRLAYWHSRPDKGQSDAINQGASKATGQYMMWINSDDLLMPGALDSFVEAFRSNPNADLVYGDQVEIDNSDGVTKRVYSSPFDIANFIHEINTIIPQQSAMWTTEIFNRVGGLKQFKYAMDYDMIYRMYDAGGTFVHFPAYLSAFRIHQGGLTGSGEVARNRASEIDISFRSFTGRERSWWDLAVRRPLYKTRRLMKTPVSLLAAVEHRLGRIFTGAK